MNILNLFRKRYICVIVGNNSGHEIPVTFMTFRRRRNALMWCAEKNLDKDHFPELTTWIVRDRRTGKRVTCKLCGADDNA